MIYLLHYDRPLHHAQHYLGSCDDAQRIQDHGNGTSRARLPQVFCELGVQFIVARTWEGGRIGERKLKNQKNARVLCPICRTHKLTVRAKQQRARRAVRKLPFPDPHDEHKSSNEPPAFVQTKENPPFLAGKGKLLLNPTCLLTPAPGAAVPRLFPVCAVQL
jgi:hypothetical protein